MGVPYFCACARAGIIMRIKMACNNKAAYVLFVLRRQASKSKSRIRTQKKNNYTSYSYAAKNAAIYCAVVASGFYIVSGCFAQSLDKDEVRQNLTCIIT